MSQHAFLSPAWIAAALAIRDEYVDHVPEPTESLRANLVVTDVPYETSEVAASIDTETSGLIPQLGHLESAELTIELSYETARTMFVSQDPAKVGEAFLAGRIKMIGDMTKLLVFQTMSPTDEQRRVAEEINRRVLEITE